MHSGERQTKEMTILNDVSLLSVLSKCVRSLALQPAWRFGYTRMTSYKGTIEIATELYLQQPVSTDGRVKNASHMARFFMTNHGNPIFN